MTGQVETLIRIKNSEESEQVILFVTMASVHDFHKISPKTQNWHEFMFKTNIVNCSKTSRATYGSTSFKLD
jgi:hypothetical protein